MIKQEISYIDYDGVEKTEERYFKMRNFYDPENWRHTYLGRPFLTKVEFDCDEEKMLSEIARYTGYSRDFIAREAVRYMYDEWFLKQPKESGPYYKIHQVPWFGPEESDEEVKMNE